MQLDSSTASVGPDRSSRQSPSADVLVVFQNLLLCLGQSSLHPPGRHSDEFDLPVAVIFRAVRRLDLLPHKAAPRFCQDEDPPPVVFLINDLERIPAVSIGEPFIGPDDVVFGGFHIDSLRDDLFLQQGSSTLGNIPIGLSEHGNLDFGKGRWGHCRALLPLG